MTSKLNPRHKEAVARYGRGVERGHFKDDIALVKAMLVQLPGSALWEASAFREQYVIQRDQNTILMGLPEDEPGMNRPLVGA